MARTPRSTQTRARTAPDESGPQETVLYSPSGVEYHSTSPREVTRLKARGYSEDKPSTEDAPDAPAETPAS